ncbi:enoyl-CoA hydratase/isomerase family protein [Propylenella binzhouense]|uniref:Enoyl-CoA hydratase/isomerase family protein n=1 Tax=Propylenella binzhouense TaxID=2555902 RepID=A0A964WU84_9HYPH|nr:enoyl-CoA hydratase/isomerase family protein [Propylenella binzhouense]MYZ48590.1 enoyl-CoA hydratase/isomerase family protein [Propylenella binzhouense]
MTTHEFMVAERGNVATIDLNRPDEGNALTRPMMIELAAAIRACGDREENRLVAIRASGSHFCRGRDGRGEPKDYPSPWERRTQAMGAVLGVYDAIAACPVPVAAFVQGPAIGFGAALAGACDITLASAAASFAFSEIEHGIPPTMAMAAVIRNVPRKALGYLIYSAETVGAEEARALGLASKVLPAEGFDAAAEAFAAGLARRPRLVLETIKRFQAGAEGLSPQMLSEYAGTLLALVRS